MNAEYVDKFREFFQKKGISTKGVAIITIQKNWTGEFSTLVIDFDNARILEHYPILQDSYEEMSVGNMKCAYKVGLTQPNSQLLGVDQNNNIQYQKPFCCPQGLSPYRQRPTAMDNIFANFIAGTGNHPNIVFEVKCQIDNGPLLSTDYFQLVQGRIEQVHGNFTNKKHSFKNYKCPSHGLFYAVDLYNAGNATVRNGHHMRLNPFTKINAQVLEAFFTAADEK